jgi:hypothetical protein
MKTPEKIAEMPGDLPSSVSFPEQFNTLLALLVGRVSVYWLTTPGKGDPT